MVTGLALAGSPLWRTEPNARFTRQQFAQIRDGMTMSEVHSFLGCAPGLYDHRSTSRSAAYWERHPLIVNLGYLGKPPGGQLATWSYDKMSIEVYFVQGKVQNKAYYAPPLPGQEFAQKWLDWLRGLVGL
jgi:hypothetical protein